MPDDLRDRILDRLPKSMRIDRANAHVECRRKAERITGTRASRDYLTYSSHLAGWDAAMAIRFEELLEENTELHATLFELISKQESKGEK